MAYFAMLEIITGVAVFAFCFVVAGGVGFGAISCGHLFLLLLCWGACPLFPCIIVWYFLYLV
jgi:hypothetical protein